MYILALILFTLSCAGGGSGSTPTAAGGNGARGDGASNPKLTENNRAKVGFQTSETKLDEELEEELEETLEEETEEQKQQRKLTEALKIMQEEEEDTEKTLSEMLKEASTVDKFTEVDTLKEKINSNNLSQMDASLIVELAGKLDKDKQLEL